MTLSSQPQTGSLNHGVSGVRSAPGKLRGAVAMGAAWTLSQSIGSQFLSLAVQLCLTRLLLPSDFGIFALAMTNYALIQAFSQTGAHNLLVARIRHFERWAPVARVACFVVGVVAFFAAVVGGFIAAQVYGVADVPQFIGISVLLGLNFPVSSLTIVPRAELTGRLQYRALAAIYFIRFSTDAVLKVLFAFLGLGVFSFAAAILLGSLAMLVATLSLTKHDFKLCFKRRALFPFLSRSTLISGTAASRWCTEEADTIVLGVFVAPEVLAPYFCASRIIRQSIQALAQQLSNCIYPALCLLDRDSRRQETAFRAAANFTVTSLSFLCFLAAVASPYIDRLLFPPHWPDATLFIVSFAVGSMFRVAAPLGNIYLLTQHKSRRLLSATSAYGFVIFGCCLAAAPLATGNQLVAYSYIVNLAHIIGSLWVLAVAIPEKRLLSLTRIFRTAIAASSLGFAAAFLTSEVTGHTAAPGAMTLQHVLPALAGVATYVLTSMAFVAPQFGIVKAMFIGRNAETVQQREGRSHETNPQIANAEARPMLSVAPANLAVTQMAARRRVT